MVSVSLLLFMQLFFCFVMLINKEMTSFLFIFHFGLRPVWVSLILATVLQHVTAKFAFIKKESGTRDLNNRCVTVVNILE